MSKKYQMQVLDGGGNSSAEIMVNAVFADMKKNGIKITLGTVNRGMAAYLKEKAHCRKSFIMKGKA